jgi:hypothetical protein
VKDAKEERGTIGVEVKGSIEAVEITIPALANARTTSIYDLGQVIVEWDAEKRTFQFITGIKGTYNKGILTIDAPENLKGEYRALINKNDRTQFLGFYKKDYTTSCTSSGITSGTGTSCKMLCEEGFLPPYIYDTDNTDLVKRFINKYKGKETDPNYTLTLALIKKLEPLGLVKQSDKYPFLNNELAKLYLALKAADDALNGDLTKLKDLIASGDNCALLQAFWTINRSEVGESRLKSLLLPDRQKALKVIAQGTLTTTTNDGFYCGYGDGGEETVLKLLLSTPIGDQKAVLDYIYSTTINGSTDTPLKVFIKNIDNGNFSDLMFILSDWVDKSYGGSTESWDKIVQRTDRAKRDYIELGDIRLGLGVGVQSEGGKTYFKFSATFQRGTIWERKNIDAESYVVVKFTEDVSVGNFNFKKGEIKKIPATLCYWIMNSMANQAGIKLGKYAMYATFGALAVGEVLAAETGIELTIAILDLGVVTADFGMNEVLADKLNQTAEGRDFLDNFAG